MLTREDGEFLLKLARNTIKKFVNNERIEKPKRYPKVLDDKRGVFCTITENNELRGCIGLPYPLESIINALISAAQSACEDPRFERLSEAELDSIKIELSILTEPKLINVEKPEDYLKEINIGRDGLIIQCGLYSGLLLPQVATEYNWSAEEFLNNLCLKAGLLPKEWKNPETRIYKFQAQIFRE
jgi:uncharacterized protein (TIGR00296 family)